MPESRKAAAARRIVGACGKCVRAVFAASFATFKCDNCHMHDPHHSACCYCFSAFWHHWRSVRRTYAASLAPAGESLKRSCSGGYFLNITWGFTHMVITAARVKAVNSEKFIDVLKMTMENYKYSTLANGYVIRLARKSELSETVRFLNDNFNHEETVFASLRSAAKWTEEKELLVRDDENRLTTSLFRQCPCLIAVYEASQKIVGANMMILSKNPLLIDEPAQSVFSTDPVRTTFMKEYLELLNKIGDDARLFERFPASEAMFEFYAIAVASEHRRLGLSKDLVDAGIRLVKKFFPDVGFVYCICTSTYSKSSAMKLGMHSISDIDLLTYKSANGQPMFQDTPPHNIVSVMALPM